MPKRKTKAAEDYHDKVAAQPCRLCTRIGQVQSTRTTVHHIREGQGTSQRAHDFLVVALCKDCHQGKLGVHGNRSLLRLANTNELELAGETAEIAWGQK